MMVCLALKMAGQFGEMAIQGLAVVLLIVCVRKPLVLVTLCRTDQLTTLEMVDGEAVIEEHIDDTKRDDSLDKSVTIPGIPRIGSHGSKTADGGRVRHNKQSGYGRSIGSVPEEWVKSGRENVSGLDKGDSESDSPVAASSHIASARVRRAASSSRPNAESERESFGSDMRYTYQLLSVYSAAEGLPSAMLSMTDTR